MQSNKNEPIYYDLPDQPAAGSTIVMTRDGDSDSVWVGNDVEACLRAFLATATFGGRDCLFRRVPEEQAFYLMRETSRSDAEEESVGRGPGRLIAGYDVVESFERTVRMDPDIAERYGIKEVYMHIENNCDTYRFLDRTGKVRPVHLAIESIFADDGENAVRQAVVDAIQSTLQPVFPARKD